MKEGMEKAGMDDLPQDLQQIFQEVDSDGRGIVDYTEFLAAALDKKQYEDEAVCWQAFRVFDRNGDGVISKEELQQVLQDDDVQKVGGGSIEEILRSYDEDGDGTIDFREFMQAIRKQGQ